MNELLKQTIKAAINNAINIFGAFQRENAVYCILQDI